MNFVIITCPFQCHFLNLAKAFIKEMYYFIRFRIYSSPNIFWRKGKGFQNHGNYEFTFSYTQCEMHSFCYCLTNDTILQVIGAKTWLKRTWLNMRKNAFTSLYGRSILLAFEQWKASCIPFAASSHTFLSLGYHATGGYLTVSTPAYATPLAFAFVEAAGLLGYPNNDANGPQQTGKCVPP